ncbi:hypothetical protein CDO44_21935 [Pigmentiphaga sp. NML080357]|uniref:hypothetical protein n=1 Tax=Pigmentiphaga sp. NML080357 TaxID=2008675 RepID=UPI000B42314D|nr:hypothetical protein [Pigmentiphaga sp. NML080357]OVZ55823.1 hypothetical protein CDO44_21935 [Pigmentiphaga sp. NML080357]
MEIEINEELRAYIDPLTDDEYAALESSLLAEGCRDALVLWGNVLVDGHNRYGICKKHGIEFRTVQNTAFRSMDDVRLWMIDNHLGRRSISDFQRGVLALRKKDILQARAAAAAHEAAPAAPEGASGAQALPASDAPADAGKAGLVTREAVAKAARLSPSIVGQIEKIQKAAAPELVAAVKSGTVSISAAAAVASLPAEEQVAAVAGGKEELRRAARQVREKRARPKRDETMPPEDGAAAADADLPPESSDVEELQRTVRALRAENADLKRRVAHLTIALKEARGGKGAGPAGEA